MQDPQEQEEIVKILFKCVNNEQLNTEEQQLLDNWIAISPHNKDVYEQVTDPKLLEKEVKELIGYDQQVMWKQIQFGINGQSRKSRLIYFLRSFAGRVAAAVVLLLVCAGAYFAFSKSSSSADKIAVEKGLPVLPADLSPGQQGAILELADGTTIALDGVANGIVQKQDNVDIIKKDGQITYNSSSPAYTPGALPLSYNTLTTRRQQHYRTTLIDGSVIWLNVGSSIKYPTVFSGAERRVILTGEAFFEVAKDASKPFIVQVASSSGAREGAGMEVEAVGTAFNINSYKDEAARTVTMTEGIVKVLSNKNVIFLKRGQQAQLSANKELKVSNSADIDKITSWKDNSFYFEDDDIETIMRQVARWYDVDIAYEGKVTNTYNAMVSRDVPVSDIFHSLELSGGVHFILTTRGGRNLIIVKP